jgi:hypothetical protein
LIGGTPANTYRYPSHSKSPTSFGQSFVWTPKNKIEWMNERAVRASFDIQILRDRNEILFFCMVK